MTSLEEEAAHPRRPSSKLVPRRSYIDFLIGNSNEMTRINPLVYSCFLCFLLFVGPEAYETPIMAPPLPKTLVPAGQSLQETWQLFASAIVKNDVVAIKYLSAKKICCFLCAVDIHQKISPSELLDLSYGKARRLSDVGIDEFIRRDAPVIFNDRLKDRVLDSSKVNFIGNEVLVGIIDESNDSAGRQAVFSFVKTKNGYRFSSYSTIP